MKEVVLLKKHFGLVVVLLLVVGISACGRQNMQSEPLEQLQIVVGETLLTISPGHVPVETLLQIQIRPEQPLKNVSAVIVGKSMYMGKIPLSFSFNKKMGVWQSDFMLGACSDPQMIWQLQVQLTDELGELRQLDTEFQSSWN